MGAIGGKQGSLDAGRYQGAFCIRENPQLQQLIGKVPSIHEQMARFLSSRERLLKQLFGHKRCLPSARDEFFVLLVY